MKAITLMILLIFFKSMSAFGQDIENFEHDLELLAKGQFSDPGIDTLFIRYDPVLFWFNDNARLGAALKGKETVSAYPLSALKSSPVYRNHVDGLLADTAYRRQSLGCFLACATGDRSKMGKIREILVKSHYKNYWAATILIYLGTKETDPILRCILAYQNSETAGYLIKDMMRLDASVLDTFGRDSLGSRNPLVQYIAIKSLVATPVNPGKIILLTQYVETADIKLKGWGLAALAKFRAGHIFPLVKDYLDNRDLRGVSLRTLAASPTSIDISIVSRMISEGVCDKDFLNALLGSENSHYIKGWLSLFEQRKFPQDYFVDIEKSKVLKDISNFEMVCRIIEQGENEDQLYGLMNYFEGKKDGATQVFLGKLVLHRFKSIRDRASQLLAKIRP